MKEVCEICQQEASGDQGKSPLDPLALPLLLGWPNGVRIKDVGEQYKKLSELLARIRSDVQIILCPGQHDAVRVAEPQPIIGRTYASPLYDIENLVLVTNPCLVKLKNGELSKQDVYNLATSFQDVAFQHLTRTIRFVICNFGFVI